MEDEIVEDIDVSIKVIILGNGGVSIKLKFLYIRLENLPLQ